MVKLSIYLLRFLSVGFIFYFFLVLLISGIQTSFLWFWISAGIFAGILSFLLPFGFKSQSNVLHWVCHFFSFLILAGFFFFLCVELWLIYFSKKTPQQEADYVIVLGAQVRGTIPSKTLNARIQTAANYLLKYPNSLVICSGGQGNTEDISEAAAIKAGLTALGITEERILLEQASTSTVENLTFSRSLCSPDTDSVVIVTSDFHLYRACQIAKKLGYQSISGLGAKEFLITTPGYYVREFFALIKEMLIGTI